MVKVISSIIKSFWERIRKMYLVLGNSAKKVELKDLDDVVYYKQQKAFNDSDYERSSDLKREIGAGRLIVLKSKKDGTPSNDGVGFPSDIVVETHSTNPDPVRVEKEVIVEKPVKEEVSPGTLELLLSKLIDLEKKVSDSAPVDKEDIVAQLMTNLEGKLNLRIDQLAKSVNKKETAQDTDSKIDQLIDLIKSGAVQGTGNSSRISDYTEQERTVDDIYVPSIRVEDGNANINLETRVIEGGSDVTDALSMLQKMKKNK